MGHYTFAFAGVTESGRDLSLTEGDIDNFIRAKGAIFAGVRTMMSAAGVTREAIADVYVAGGIGSGINVEGAVRVGMLPKINITHYHYIGNTSLSGAYAMLHSRKAARTVRKIAGGMTYMELSAQLSYMDEFVAACFLPHTNGAFFDDQ
jgi:uncharacterized 2Fe-2S/4Fe-4S cluster protein (DUF4445 family)